MQPLLLDALVQELIPAHQQVIKLGEVEGESVLHADASITQTACQ